MYFSDQAIILARRDFREDDLLINAYSSSHGKLRLQAKGAKKIKSKLAGHLEPISLSSLNWVTGRNIDQLTGAVLNSGFLNIKQDENKILIAGSFVNLVDRLTHENLVDHDIFNLLASALNFLENNQLSKNLAKLTFGFKLLHILGFNPANKTVRFKEDINFIVASSMQQINAANFNAKISSLNIFLKQEIINHTEN